MQIEENQKQKKRPPWGDLCIEKGMEKIHGKNKSKDYLKVAFRICWFRQDYPLESGWRIITSIIEKTETLIVVKAEVINDKDIIMGCAHAEEVYGSTYINKSSALENAETSAIGRVLANIGYTGENYDFASAEEVRQSQIYQEQTMLSVNNPQVANKPKAPNKNTSSAPFQKELPKVYPDTSKEDWMKKIVSNDHLPCSLKSKGITWENLILERSKTYQGKGGKEHGYHELLKYFATQKNDTKLAGIGEECLKAINKNMVEHGFIKKDILLKSYEDSEKWATENFPNTLALTEESQKISNSKDTSHLTWFQIAYSDLEYQKGEEKANVRQLLHIKSAFFERMDEWILPKDTKAIEAIKAKILLDEHTKNIGDK